uniref:VWFA domain-containing protein n=1 Tax=Clastoptera arizonana TaxID=38151 RepID=A0A1B6BXM8_9HEMI
MNLEDGRFLVSASRYDKLLKENGEEQLKKWGLVRVSEDFRVIALGLPVPGYYGNPLDPPLRSRFQARNVSTPSYKDTFDLLAANYPTVPQDKLSQLLSCAFALMSPESQALGLPDFPGDNLHIAAQLLAYFPWYSVRDAVKKLYPYETLLNTEGQRAVEDILNSFRIKQEEHIPEIETISVGENFTNAVLKCQGKKAAVLVPCGNITPTSTTDIKNYVRTEFHEKSLVECLESHSCTDICILGPRGCGKSTLVNRLAHKLGYTVQPIVLYQDMTNRDLIQQRTTLPNGDTIWKNSPLVDAALNGNLAVLDGLHRLHPSTTAVLQRLIHDRELQLYDGHRLIRHDRYDDLAATLGCDKLKESGILRIHPSFRIIALAEPPTATNASWLNPELLTLFAYHEMPSLTKEQELHIIESLCGKVPSEILDIITISHILRSSSDATLQSLATSLSTRQLLRISRRAVSYPLQSSYSIIQQACLAKFLPPLARQALESVLKRNGIQHSSFSENRQSEIQFSESSVTIGQTKVSINKTVDSSKVPDIVFYNIPQHVLLLERLIQDYTLGEHLLLVGNQGVGKNKIADRLLQLLNLPREYIQLHRDTTVQSLTLQATVRDGVVLYEDSPLVQAVKEGHVLVVDEADKAPTHVTCILKTLVESGEMILSDGRRIVPNTDIRLNLSNTDNIIPIHPNFRMIVLANRPGFPFLGNDFFGALGDLFSCHAVDNPSEESEIALLTQYAPDVPLELIQRIVTAFAQLRDMADQGLVSYPYSTREVVNIVKHMQAYPDDSLADTVANVFDFDLYSRDLRDTLLRVLANHGIHIPMTAEEKKHKDFVQLTVDRHSGLDVSSPKHGKVDEKGDPHVGGNTWAGGTGGRDTAGLGGKGGPYRLDAGHTVHQLSDEEKASVPEHVRKAAREMAQKAFKKKLEEIKMSEYDASLYEQFSSAVSNQVQALRVILNSLQAKSKDRQWLRHQTSGDLDDAKLIEGITGEKNVYRRRGEKEPEVGAPQTKPKRLRLVVDVSGSMYRFNGFDQRLERQLEAVTLVMESFHGYETRIQYDIVGHSGEGYGLTFIHNNGPPLNNKERLDVIKTMHAHAQFCMSGDNTLEATEHAVSSLAEEDCDEAIVIVLSDANLSRYAIPPKKLTQALTCNTKVDAYAIFIGSLGDQAERLVAALPAGKGFLCMNLNLLPQILHQIFTSSILKTR